MPGGMTFERISQYQRLKGRLTALQHEIADESERVWQSSVQASAGYPTYDKKTITVEGCPAEHKRYVADLKRRRRRVKDELRRIRKFIYGIEDDVLRKLYIGRFIEGMEWLPAAEKARYAGSDSVTLNYVKRNLEKLDCGGKKQT